MAAHYDRLHLCPSCDGSQQMVWQLSPLPNKADAEEGKNRAVVFQWLPAFF